MFMLFKKEKFIEGSTQIFYTDIKESNSKNSTLYTFKGVTLAYT